jgi:hypothetical protein
VSVRPHCHSARCKLLRELRAAAVAAGKMLPAYLVSVSADGECVSQLLVKIGRIERIIALCKTSEATRLLYQNAWCVPLPSPSSLGETASIPSGSLRERRSCGRSYHFLKLRVLSISDERDYKYLDRLFVNDVEIRDNGILYLLALLGDQAVGTSIRTVRARRIQS